MDVRKNYIISFWISLIVAVGLLVTGFFTPPKAQIHPSVLEGAGILWLFPALAFGAKALEEGNTAKIQKGDTTLEFGKNKE